MPGIPADSPSRRLRRLLAEPGIKVMPCCFDALSARLIEAAGFPCTFMSGFAVAATRLGLPDTGLISYGEMLEQGRSICAAVTLPVLGDGDTGYGNAMNVKRTVRGYASAGFAAVMLEDQVWPKRCGHTQGKQVVSRAEAVSRIQAAVDTREEGADILILARTDTRATHGLEEALTRARAFAEAGADMLFVEAPHGEEEMRRICTEAPGVHLANMLENGVTPLLTPAHLQAIGYGLVAYPLTLLSSAIRAMQGALAALRRERHPAELVLDFDELRRLVGFDAYDAEAARYGVQDD